MRVVVSGTSNIKYEAAKKAVNQLDISVQLLKVPPTEINEQPIGEEEILSGAILRAELAKENDLILIPTLYLGIENGIEEELTTNSWFDYAFIFGIFPEGERVTRTIKCQLPTECVIATSKLPGGFKDNTVGKYMASIGLVKDHADPHIDLCGMSRVDILAQSIKDLIDRC